MLRPLLATLVPDDLDYDDPFDETEVLLAVLGEDARLQARDRTTTCRIRPMVVSPGARSTTRTHPPTHAARGTRRRRQFSFAVHLFGGSAERAAAAFESYCNDAEEVISRSRC